MKGVGQVTESRLRCATKWRKLYKEGKVALYSYWDGVDWKQHYAIKVNGENKIFINEDEKNLDPFKIFQAICIIVNGVFDEKKFFLKNF